MTTGAQFPSSSWRELYKAALFETDRNQIPNRINEAEKAIIKRARELFGSTTDTIEEDQALDDALYALRALQHCLGSNDSAPAAARIFSRRSLHDGRSWGLSLRSNLG